MDETLVNKFYLPWQIVRLQAKKARLVENKIIFVWDYLDGDPSAQNFERVRNWAEMLKLAYYEGRAERRQVQEMLDTLHNHKALGLFQRKNMHETNDFQTYWNDLSTRFLLRELRKDLHKRKYAFQFKGKPKAHVEFMCELEKFLAQYSIQEGGTM